LRASKTFLQAIGSASSYFARILLVVFSLAKKTALQIVVTVMKWKPFEDA